MDINTPVKPFAHLTKFRMPNSLLSFALLAIFYASASGLVFDDPSHLPSLTYDYIVVGGELHFFRTVIESPS
jgi:hypothetical protein